MIKNTLARIKKLGNTAIFNPIKKPINKSCGRKKLNPLLAWGSFFTIITITVPALAADKIKFLYDSLELTLKIESLRILADEGTVNANLRDFFKIVKPTEEEIAKFRETLVKPFDIDPVELSRILNTDEGDRLLTKMGSLIEIQGGSNGKTVLRGSMIQAAADPEGLTVLNFLETLPTNMQIDVKESLRRSEQADFIVKATHELIKATATLAQEEISSNSAIDYSQLPKLNEPGPISVVNERWELTDTERDRNFYVEVFRPETEEMEQIPVVIFSHGLHSSPEYSSEALKLLASHGFLVVAPQHPGSDIKQQEALAEGLTRQLFVLNEFIDRPLDLKYTLDELEKRNQTEFDGKLNLTNVGAFGHSFGGYTALAVAGATIDLEHLEQDCNSEGGKFNIALFLQCRALKLEEPIPNFKDERIGAVLIANPVNASIYGPEGLAKVEVPILISAGGYDVATPYAFEKARSFPWLVNAPKSYLLLQEAEGHTNVMELDGGSHFIMTSALKLNLPDDENLRYYYGFPTFIGFSQVYLAGNNDYKVYLDPGYQAYLSEGQKFKSFLITEKSAAGLEMKFEEQAELFRDI